MGTVRSAAGHGTEGKDIDLATLLCCIPRICFSSLSVMSGYAEIRLRDRIDLPAGSKLWFLIVMLLDKKM